MRIGVQTTKSTLFRGVQQEFHNVYYYNLATAVTAPAESILDEIVALEKTWHSSVVNFVRGSVWSAGGTAQENQMLFQKALSGAGATTALDFLDRERAYLIQWPAGFDVRGLPVYLRKWFHSCGLWKGLSAHTDPIYANTAQITQADRDAIGNDASALNEVGGTEAWDLSSRTGREWEAQPTCHPYLEHHQLGDMWR